MPRGRPKQNQFSGDITISEQFETSDVTSSQAAEFQVWYNKQKKREQFIRKGKRSVRAIGYSYIPYFNKPKKNHLGKVCVKLQNELRGIVYSVLVAKNVSRNAVQNILSLSSDACHREHLSRYKKPNYGF